MDDRKGYADKLAADKNWLGQTVRTRYFELFSHVPASQRALANGVLNVYLEGDGYAWRTRTTPSMDPTPDDPIALRLAMRGNQGASVYLARPCQYVIAQNAQRCGTAYWTSARYSEPVVQSMDEAVTILKTRYGASRVRLIGYSGGGVVAALLAARRSDVAELVTVAANLDTAYWTSYHRVSPLYDSLNPASYGALAAVPQVHFVGAKDEIVPQAVVVSYLRSISRPVHGSLVQVPGADHECCWSDFWPGVYDRWRASQ